MKPDDAAHARQLARTILSFFCAFTESDGVAVKRSLDSIATIIFSLAGRKEAMKKLSDYNPHVVAVVDELSQLHTAYRDMAVLLPSRLVRLTPPGESIEVPSPSTLRRIAKLLRFTSRRTARRGAQTKNKRTPWALRRVLHADQVIRRLHRYAPLPSAVNWKTSLASEMLAALAACAEFTPFLEERDWTALRRASRAMDRVSYVDQLSGTVRAVALHATLPPPGVAVLSSPGDLLKVLAPHGEFSYFLTEGDWRALRCVAPSLSKFTLRCAAAIKTPLSLDGMIHTDENSMTCTVGYVPAFQKVKDGGEVQQTQTVKFDGT